LGYKLKKLSGLLKITRRIEKGKIMKKMKYVDFWKGFDIYDNYFSKLFDGDIEITDSDNADVLMYSCFGKRNMQYQNYVKFFYTGENVRSNFKAADYSIGFDYIDSDRYYRWPLYNLYGIDNLPRKYDNSKRDKFCSVVVSKPSCIYRNLFFDYLNRIRHVDSGGRFQNNIGYVVQNKHDFLTNYKFSITFENSSYPGYTTEKVLEAKRAGCIPIYWGNPLVERDFNKEAFINVHSFDSWDDVVKYILEVDENDSLFLKIQTAPLIIHDTYTNKDNFKDWFLDRIDKKIERKKVKYVKGKPEYVYPGINYLFVWYYKQIVFKIRKDYAKHINQVKRLIRKILNILSIRIY